jgi:hypothetical protein
LESRGVEKSLSAPIPSSSLHNNNSRQAGSRWSRKDRRNSESLSPSTADSIPLRIPATN